MASPYAWLEVETSEGRTTADRLVVDLSDLPDDDPGRIIRRAIATEVRDGRLMLAPNWRTANDLRHRLFGEGPPEVIVRG